MKVIPIALDAHYQEKTTSLALLWRIVRTDGLIFRLTDHDRPIRFEAEVYATSSGFGASAVTSRADMSVDNMETLGILSAAGITTEDVEAGRWDYARVRLLRVNWRRPQDGAEVVRSGTLGKIKLGRGMYTAELRGKMQALQTHVGDVVTPNCRADLGDERCLVGIEALREYGTIGDVESRRLFTVDGIEALPEGFLNGGEIRVESGLNAGFRIEIREHLVTSDGVTIELQLSLPFIPTPGDDVSVLPGCDKSKAMCIATYDNLIHFRGFDFVPGPDDTLQVGGQ